jgi:LemA protein
MDSTLVIVLVVLAVLVLLFVVIYNGLVQARNRVDNSWAQIEVQLKRRYDLIPNLVETVKGYASHERETLEAVIQARNAAQNVSGDMAHAAEKGLAENMLTQALGRLFALSEAYPDLKANTNFMQLQEELASTENKIGFSRQHYNDVVGRYEAARMQFPGNIVAGAFNFVKGTYFEIDEKAQREAPQVSFS